MATVSPINSNQSLQYFRKMSTSPIASVPSPDDYLIYILDMQSYLVADQFIIRKVDEKKRLHYFSITKCTLEKSFLLVNIRFDMNTEKNKIISVDTFSDCQITLENMKQSAQRFGNSEVIELPNKNEHDIYDLGYNQNDSSIGKDQVDDQLEKLLNEIADQALVVDDDTQFHRATKKHNLSAEVSSLEFVEHRISSRSEMHFGT
ncbi:unnamed protein product [Rotaria magnacalcarata]|uniref:Uncharacterized protein n=1 Tax=Rotaria magnacalcarata TaxID=392030 RepID=A0A816ZFH1_9BILA|nr:unnamed protein product [Rotaria magnacalcarata]